MSQRRAPMTPLSSPSCSRWRGLHFFTRSGLLGLVPPAFPLLPRVARHRGNRTSAVHPRVFAAPGIQHAYQAARQSRARASGRIDVPPQPPRQAEAHRVAARRGTAGTNADFLILILFLILIPPMKRRANVQSKIKNRIRIKRDAFRPVLDIRGRDVRRDALIFQKASRTGRIADRPTPTHPSGNPAHAPSADARVRRACPRFFAAASR